MMDSEQLAHQDIETLVIDLRRELKEFDLFQKISKSAIKRLTLDLGGSHTLVTYPQLSSLEATTGEFILDLPRKLPSNVYVHFPGCEFICPFCNYETKLRKPFSALSEQESSYFDALLNEWEDKKKSLNVKHAKSIYFGGGTPTAFPLDTIKRIAERVRTTTRQIPFCIESSPQTTSGKEGRQQLDRVAMLGVNRISLGIQTFDAELLPRMRGHQYETLVDSLDNLSGFEFELNIDLIQDLPGQNLESIINDLVHVAKYKPAQVTWYTMRLGIGASWRRRLDAGDLVLEDGYESLLKRLLIVRVMKLIGYELRPGGRFVLDKKTKDIYKNTRAKVEVPLIGLGVSAYSHISGTMFRNTYSQYTDGKKIKDGVTEYISLVSSKSSPIVESRVLEERDYIISDLISGIRSNISKQLYLSVQQVESRAKGIIERLISQELMTRDAKGIRLTDMGRLLEEEICASVIPEDIQSAVELCHS